MKVTVDGLTVATVGSIEVTDAVKILLLVRLHPFLPSPLVGETMSWVVPSGPPKINGIDSATASMLASRLLWISSAKAGGIVPSTNTGTAAAAADRRENRMALPYVSRGPGPAFLPEPTRRAGLLPDLTT